MRAYAQQGVDRGAPPGQQLKRAAREERRAIAKWQIERGDVLTEELRVATGRCKTCGAAREHGLGNVDAMDTEACVEEWHQHPPRARHRFEYRAGSARKPRNVPGNFLVRRPRLVGVVEKRGQRAAMGGGRKGGRSEARIWHCGCFMGD